MKTEFDKDYFLMHKGCYSSQQVESTYPVSKTTVSTNEILDSDMPLADKFWIVIKVCELTNKQKQELVTGVADIVIELFENDYPKVKLPRESIQAVKEFLKGEITIDELKLKKNKSNIFVTIAFNDFNQGIIKQPIAKDAILSIDATLKNIDAYQIPFSDQTEYINNASFIAAESAVISAVAHDIVLTRKAKGITQKQSLKLFQDLLLNYLKEFIEKQSNS